MFESRIPLYLILSALVLVMWSAATQAPAIAWTLIGLVIASIVSAFVIRAGRSERSVAVTLDEAARLNAARNAAPRSTTARETR